MNRQRKIVMVFGTFDLIHPGHVYFLKEAKKLGDFLVVSVARDINVKKIKKRQPLFSENVRAAHIKELGVADKIVLGDKKNYINHVKKISPHIIALGHDQKAYTTTLAADLKKAGIECRIYRMKPYKRKIYRSSKLKAKLIK